MWVTNLKCVCVQLSALQDNKDPGLFEKDEDLMETSDNEHTVRLSSSYRHINDLFQTALIMFAIFVLFQYDICIIVAI